MRSRNRLLAFLCLLAFLGVGWLYLKTWVVQKPFAVILFLSDAMTPPTLAAARIYDRGVDSRLTIENFPYLALTSSYARDAAVPDAAAAAAALASGERVGTGGKTDAPSLLMLARAQGRSTGLITTGKIGQPGNAAFLPARLDRDAMPDVLFGGGESAFLPAAKGGTRQDNRDLLLELSRDGVEIVRTEADLRELGSFRTSKLLGIFGNGPLPLSTRGGSEPREPPLPEMVRRAIQILQNDPQGYLLVVEADGAARAAAANEGEQYLRETVHFDEAVNAALRYAGENTLIVVTGYRSVGGLTLNASPLRTETGLAILGTNAAGIPALTWATGPAVEPEPRPGEPVAYRGPGTAGVATDMVATGKGDGAEGLRGFIDSTAIFKLIRDKL